MPFDPIKNLKNGNVDFILNDSLIDLYNLATEIRENDDKENIIIGFLHKLSKTHPAFCFKVIYDVDIFEEDAIILFERLLNAGYKLDDKRLIDILYKTSWGKKCIFKIIDRFLENIKGETIEQIVYYALENNDLNYINYFRNNKNLHYRYLFMNCLIKKYPNKLLDMYDNILNYLTEYNYLENEQLEFSPVLMSNPDICNLAYTIFNSKHKDKYYEKLKDFILNNYPLNDLAKVLLQDIKNEKAIKEFNDNADILFKTSETEKLNILDRRPKYVSDYLKEEFRKSISIFREKDYYVLTEIFEHRLGSYLLSYVEKYLSISKDKTVRFLTSGSTGSVYQVGDYVIKLYWTKFNDGEVICPNSYLIIKNLEEHYVRNEKGYVEVGLEVQKYLTKKADGISNKTLKQFLSAIKKENLIIEDNLFASAGGDNCLILDSYKDADHYALESLPDWFKETPIVLVDRDLVRKKVL